MKDFDEQLKEIYLSYPSGGLQSKKEHNAKNKFNQDFLADLDEWDEIKDLVVYSDLMIDADPDIEIKILSDSEREEIDGMINGDWNLIPEPSAIHYHMALSESYEEESQQMINAMYKSKMAKKSFDPKAAAVKIKDLKRKKYHKTDRVDFLDVS